MGDPAAALNPALQPLREQPQRAQLLGGELVEVVALRAGGERGRRVALAARREQHRLEQVAGLVALRDDALRSRRERLLREPQLVHPGVDDDFDVR